MNPELLLPVGNMQMCLAAIHHGADAIYVGVPFFNARGRTTDFSLDDLKEMIDLCHLYGVRVNLAFNVVIFQNEFPQVIELLEKILPLGPDAFIVQDLGLAQLIRQMAPQQRIHGSTQMTVTNADAMKLVDDLKIDRFVLGRENSLQEIKLMREKTDKELEVFVHGALCVAYSGQCFTSESLGGRSANRGQCAQSCRLEYELYVDEKKVDMGEKKYLVSPKDLMGLAEVPALRDLGVNSFKIEGRLKTPEYVASTARNYREVLDGGPLRLESRALELGSTYSRGFFSGWLNGVDHQNLVGATYSSHQGTELSEIKEIRGKKITLKSKHDLRAGMGLLFTAPGFEKGSKIFSVEKNGEIELLQKNLDLKPGMKVFLNSNESLDKELQKAWTSREHQKRIPLAFKVSGQVGGPLKVVASDLDGRSVEASTQSFLSEAATNPITTTALKDELSSLGTTAYVLKKFESDLGPNLFIHNKELKNLRRDLVARMNEARIKRSTVILPAESRLAQPVTKDGEGQLNILLRTRAQVEGFAESFDEFAPYKSFIKTVILDFEFGKDYLSSVELIKSLGLPVAIATTRILKPQEYYNLNIIMRAKPDKILVRNLGALEYLKQQTTIPLLGDFSLNVTNDRTLSYLIGKGLETINASYDLNLEQLTDMIRASNPENVEVTLHQYMPEFHMEHCVFAAFMSKGHSFRDCGKPCEKHEVKLKDPYGHFHHLKADQECRNTFFKAAPQSAGFLVGELAALGVRTFRLEALNELPAEANSKILLYLKLLSGEISSNTAASELKIMESYGMTTNHLHKRDDYQDRKKT
jgi:putative protease